MKLVSLSENIRKTVLTAEKIIGKNLSLPILSNILLETEKGQLKILATNLEIGIVCFTRAKIEKEGKIAVPGRVLGSYLSTLSDGLRVNIEDKNKTLYLTSESGQVAIKGFDTKDFPIIPRPQSEHLFEVDGYILQKMMSKILVCSAISETRQELTGVYFGLKEKELVFAATDSFRLAEVCLKLGKDDIAADYPKFISKNPAIIVPSKTLQEVIKNIDNENSRVKVYIGENQIFFEVDSILFVSRLIDGKYPEYRQVIPRDFSSSVFVNRENLSKAVRTASIFSDSKSREVKFHIKESGNKMVIKSQSVETGESIIKIPCQAKIKKETVISFNNRYLTDALNSLSSEMIYIGFNDNFGPVIFREVQKEKELDKNHFHIIMPIRS